MNKIQEIVERLHKLTPEQFELFLKLYAEQYPEDYKEFMSDIDIKE